MLPRTNDHYTGPVPHHGGDKNHYNTSNSNPGKTLVFVNGIMNSPQDHAAACVQLANATACSVLGVYNQRGFERPAMSRLKSALDDAGTHDSLHRLAGKAIGAISAALDIGFDVGQCISDQAGLIARAYGYNGKSPNGCTRSLLELLVQQGGRWPDKPLCIVAHSQGNLIVSNALMQYSAMVTAALKSSDDSGKKFIARGIPRIHVFSVASPAVSWPTNSFISVDNFWHAGDFVALLSLSRNVRGSAFGHGALTRVSFKHSLDSYMADSGNRLVKAICDKAGTTFSGYPSVKNSH